MSESEGERRLEIDILAVDGERVKRDGVAGYNGDSDESMIRDETED